MGRLFHAPVRLRVANGDGGPAFAVVPTVVSDPQRTLFRALGRGRGRTCRPGLRLGRPRTGLLGAEDIFSYLCRAIGPEQPIQIDIDHQRYCLALRFFCPAAPLQLRLLNVTARSPLERGEASDDFDLFTVSRMVDALRVTREPDGRICLAVVVERRYSEKTKPDPGEAGPAPTWQVRAAGPADLPCLAARVTAHYPEAQYPGFLLYPGKAADVIAAGAWQAACAVGEQGVLLGGVLWHALSPQTLEMCGPFLFPPTQPAELGAALVEYVLEATAKTEALGILARRYEGQPMPAGFEPLGTLRTRAADGPAAEVLPIYRQLHEDLGTVVYAHPALEAFLRQEFARLVLPLEPCS